MASLAAASGLAANRRQVLTGGLLLGLAAAPGARAALAPIAGPLSVAGAASLNAYVAIAPDGEITIVTPGAEMGQGVSHGMPKIVAEELDADWSRVVVKLSGAAPAYLSPVNKRQRSANSDGITSYYEGLRRVGATARAMLVTAAAQRWKVDPATVTTRASVLIHPDGKTQLPYAALAGAAALLPVPADVPLKDAKAFTLIGKDFPRKDMPAKVMGTAVFGMDLELPGMLYAALRHAPVTGAKLASYSADKARGMPGVRKVVQIGDAVGVIADSYWQAQQAADALELTAEPGELGDSAAIRQRMVAALEAKDGVLPFPVGFAGGKPDMGATPAQIDAALTGAAHRFEAIYEVPYLAHATMEPLCCTARVEGANCEIWGPLQCADAVPPDVAKATGIPAENVKVNRTFIGGGFGRKNERDFVIEAVQLAQAMPGRPVMMVWSRAEDMRNDYYRPAFAARMRAGVDKQGKILAMEGRIAGQSLITTAPMRRPGWADFGMAGDLVSDRYAPALSKVDAVEIAAPLRTGYWRSVSASQNGFFQEAFIDEIAEKLKRDPLAYRRQLVAQDARSVAVLDLLAETSGWSAKRRKGQGIGCSLMTGWNSRCAQAIEVEVTGKALAVKRIVCVFDCGQVIDPDNVVAQMEGGIVFGLSAALFGKITVKDGVIEQSSFADYPVVLLRSAPKIEVHLVRSEAAIGGVGEAAVPGIAPALTGAIFQATGKRLRALPINDAFEVAV